MSDQEATERTQPGDEGRDVTDGRAGDSAQRRDDSTAQPARSTPFTQQVGRAAIAILIAIFGALAFANIDPVDIDLIFGIVRVRLFILIILTFAAGMVTGVLIGWRYHRQRRRA